ncbi:17660_t:CDS:2 [Funneliformis geosporum]|uniref:17660_t:CDS:1 n=1 Tax=Funneliformis geosporum TaxID=1117311 RepID=A0A9W4WX00_9GLOM|nr:17660_t:CDS:2 [Funneliformis geosporum]
MAINQCVRLLELFKVMEEKLNLLSDLSNDMGRLFSSGDRYDVIIKAGEGPNMKEFYTHALILGERFSDKNIDSGRIMKITTNSKEQNYAVSYDKNSGPAFGRGWDLKITNNKLIRHSTCKTYPNISLALYHKDNILEDYEVFQVENKY